MMSSNTSSPVLLARLQIVSMGIGVNMNPIVRGHPHQPPNKSPGFKRERSSDIGWFFAAMLLGESIEAFSGDEALRNAVR
jgi:hypothetical protein